MIGIDLGARYAFDHQVLERRERRNGDRVWLIATGIAVAIIPVLTGLGTKLKTTFSTISTALK